MIQRRVDKQGKRNALSRFYHARNDSDKTSTWRRELDRILYIFNVRSAGLV